VAKFRFRPGSALPGSRWRSSRRSPDPLVGGEGTPLPGTIPGGPGII